MDGALPPEMVEEILAMSPFAKTAGVEIDEAGPEVVRGRIEWAPERCTADGSLHGGALMTLGDTLGALCALLNLPAGSAATTTIESKTNFFRAVREGTVSAVTRPLHAGRTTIVVQTDLIDEAGRRVAQITQTQAVLQPH